MFNNTFKKWIYIGAALLLVAIAFFMAGLLTQPVKITASNFSLYSSSSISTSVTTASYV